jgi:hypothetical protein
MFDILSIIPGKKKQTSSGWTSFNALCCSHRGHTPDRRGRGGIKFDGQTNWVMHCFNCNYSCSFTLGRTINSKTRQFLTWCGVDNEQIQRWSLESLQHKDILDFIIKQKREEIKFKTKKLPDGDLLEVNNPQHKFFVDYLQKRKVNLDKYEFYVNPNSKNRTQYGIIVPYTYKDKIVGNTTRYIDNKIPKFINDQQQGYVFNIDNQNDDWTVCILVEGIFDAISIDGVATMHDDISNEQASVLAQLNKKIIFVPDQDKTGLKVTDRALELGYHVSLPEWGHDIKDVNDAVVKYGKLPTLLSILEHATMSKIKIELRKKQIAKGI